MDMLTLLQLSNRTVGVRRVKGLSTTPQLEAGCTLRVLNRVFAGETLVLSPENCRCRGSLAGMGFQDGLPEIPGGFGNFVSCGRGEGFPPGERIKCDPHTGEQMLLIQPQSVLETGAQLQLSPFAAGEAYDTVITLVNADQLSVLVHLFCFRRHTYDDVIAPMVSGCASLFRIPFGELRSERSRAVIGNIDVFSRPHFPKETFFLTFPGDAFCQMLADAPESVLASHIIKPVLKRIATDNSVC